MSITFFFALFKKKLYCYVTISFVITTSEYTCRGKNVLLVLDYCNFVYHLLLSIRFNLQTQQPRTLKENFLHL